MRILVLSNLYPPHHIGGYELRCRDVVDLLVRRGHRVSVLTSMRGVGRPSRDGHVERVLHSRWDLPRRRRWLAMKLAAEAADAVTLWRAIRRERPDVVFCWNMFGLSYSLLRAAGRAGVPVVLHVEDDWLMRQQEFLRRWPTYGGAWMAAVARVARPIVTRVLPTTPSARRRMRWVFVSEHLKRRYERAGLSVPDATVIYGGIPVEAFSGRRFTRFAGADSPRRMLYVGAVTPAKGLHLAIEALARARREGCGDVSLTVVGHVYDPDYGDALRKAVVANDLVDRVTFVGAMERQDLPAVFAEHDALLFTSTVAEGFPLTILEAMAAGLVVISSDSGGQREILQDGQVAFTFRAGDSEDLAGCIRRVADDPDLARRVAVAGHRLVHEELTLEKMADKYEELLGRLVGAAATTDGAAVSGAGRW